MSEPSKKTPLMEQYYAIKARYPDAILFFRMGDFYEMFDEDAKITSEILGIALTSRNHGLDDRTPLAGVPYHSADKYLSKLLRSGFKVAICEQIEDPKFAKGIVKRDVIEVMTPGTITIEDATESSKNQFLVGILQAEEKYFVCAVDVLSGDFFVKVIDGSDLFDELANLEPAEFLVPDNVPESFLKSLREHFQGLRISLFEPWQFEFEGAQKALIEHFGIGFLDGLGEFSKNEISIAGAVISYLRQLKKGKLHHIRTLSRASESETMLLDEATVRNLELVASLSDGGIKGTLLWSLDETQTPMGERLLRRWILSPLVDMRPICMRQEAVQALISCGMDLTKLRQLLSGIGDMERIAGKIGNHKANPRDLVMLAQALKLVDEIRQLDVFRSPLLEKILKRLDSMPDVRGKIENTIIPDPPIQISEGGIIRQGVMSELDELRLLRDDSSTVLRDMEKKLRERTGIEKLRIGYNQVFGYYIEITKAQAVKAPEDFIRKQTLVNAERFITPELKELEAKLLAADERIKYIEKELFLNLLAELSIISNKISDVADAISEIDVLSNFAHIAIKKRYCRPKIADDGTIEILGGRHPVLEDIIGRSAFVPNNLRLDDKTQIIILTGPNMAGKSTYLRQNGIIVLMAQIGSFVPADSAHITPVDRIFTRVGATDYIARGQSTFLVEMLETANILRHATENSLVLLDEVGRGTSTFDGLSIAWAVAEYLHDSQKHRAKTIFATHYHELTELQNYLPRVRNFQVAIRERDGKIAFLHQIIPGGCDDSYGIQVAQLAGVPDDVISRAQQVLEILESGETPSQAVKKFGGRKGKTEKFDGFQISLFDPEYHPLVLALKELNIENLTPLQALQIIADWKKKWER